MQDKIKTQLNQIQEQVNKQFEAAKSESIRILKELGVNTEAEELILSDALSEIREANPTVKEFARNLNVATYDNRFRANWNATMGTAFAKLNIEKAYIDNIKPRIIEARSTISAKVDSAQQYSQELRAKITS